MSAAESLNAPPPGPWDTARIYAERGFRVFPLWSVRPDGTCQCPDGAKCGSPGKHPVSKGWQVEASADIRKIEAWSRLHSSRNVGVLCGAPSGLVVVDVDSEEWFSKLLEELGAPSIGPTLTATTGKGRHLYYRAPEGLDLDAFPGGHPLPDAYGNLPSAAPGEKAPGVDYKARGGYVVIPGSRHYLGGLYTCEEPHAPLATLSEAWIERMRTPGSVLRSRAASPEGAPPFEAEKVHHTPDDGSTPDDATPLDSAPRHERRLDMIRTRSGVEYPARRGTPVDRASRAIDVTPGAGEGTRNHRMFEVACTLVHHFDLSPGEALPLLESWLRRCSPPYAQGGEAWRARRAVREADDKGPAPSDRGSALKIERDPPRAARPGPSRAPHVRAVPPPPPSAPRAREEAPHEAGDTPPPPSTPRPREEASEGLGMAVASAVELPPPPAEPPTELLSFVRGDEVELSEALLDRLAARGEPLAYDGTLRRYDARRGIWPVVPEHEAWNIVRTFAGAAVAAQPGKAARALSVSRNMIKGAVDIAHKSVTRPDAFARPAKGLGFSNGFLRLDGMALAFVPHDPEHRATWCYDFAYDPSDTACPAWLDFLRALFRDDADKDQRIKLVQQWGGAALAGLAPDYEKALVLHGTGGEGKSTLLAAFQMLFPQETCCAVPPQRMGDEYQRAELQGKRLNIVAELPEQDILESETFKASVTGKDLISGRMIFGKPVSFVSRCAHLFAVNTLPRVKDPTEGFWRRWIVLPLTRRFAEHEKIRKIEERIIGAERTAIVNWFLAGAIELLSQIDYTVPPSCVRALDEWRGECNTVGLWFGECCRLSIIEAKEKPNTATALYRDYVKWCLEGGYKPPSQKHFSGKLNALLPAGKQWRPRNGNAQCYAVQVFRRDVAEAHRVAFEEAANDAADDAAE